MQENRPAVTEMLTKQTAMSSRREGARLPDSLTSLPLPSLSPLNAHPLGMSVTT